MNSAMASLWREQVLWSSRHWTPPTCINPVIVLAVGHHDISSHSKHDACLVPVFFSGALCKWMLVNLLDVVAFVSFVFSKHMSCATCLLRHIHFSKFRTSLDHLCLHRCTIKRRMLRIVKEKILERKQFAYTQGIWWRGIKTCLGIQRRNSSFENEF